jgi:NADPH:quinone reductase-like Zn-dependent oxidoreductase
LPKELIFVGPRELAYREYADRALRNREIRIKMVCSGISHGTEMAMYRGTAAQLHGFVSTDRSNLSYPFVYGYEEVGEVVEVGEAVEEFTLGELVCSWLGHRETGIIDIDALDRRWGVTLERVPPNCRREEGVFMSLACVARYHNTDVSSSHACDNGTYRRAIRR